METIDINMVLVSGTLERDPIHTRTNAGGTQLAFNLQVTEAGASGKRFVLFMKVEVYGALAEGVNELRAGMGVLVAGKLKLTTWTSKDGAKRSGLCILAKSVRPLALGSTPSVRQ